MIIENIQIEESLNSSIFLQNIGINSTTQTTGPKGNDGTSALTGQTGPTSSQDGEHYGNIVRIIGLKENIHDIDNYNHNKQKHSSHLGNYIVPLNTKDGICVDIGGNTGQFSLKYANFFKLIHIYEPQEECHEIIKESIKPYKNLTLYKEAVYDKSNENKILISHTNLDSGSVALNSEKIEVKEWTDNVVNECLTISLEDILRRVGGVIDYIKIDCETSEYNLLYNKDLRNIKYMGIELHWQLGETNFNNLVSHILKYFDNPYNYELSYPNLNIEVLFVSKYL